MGTDLATVFKFTPHSKHLGSRFLVNQDGLKLNGTHKHLAYVDNVNILGGSIHMVKENAEALVAAIKEIGLEVST
jgi:hypothetical protein